MGLLGLGTWVGLGILDGRRLAYRSFNRGLVRGGGSRVFSIEKYHLGAARGRGWWN